MTKFSNNGSGSATVIRCIESERQALLHFKKGLIDRANLLSSWTNEEEDCCRWSRVRCDKHTGHVVMLDLRPIMIGRDGIYALGGDGNFVWTGIGGELSSSLLELPYLSHLDLSNNWFSDIPEFMGSLSTLIYLDLSNNAIETFPYQLGNLSMLQYLDLSLNYEMRLDSIGWLDRLSSLRVLKSDELWGSNCQFPEIYPSSLSHVDSSKSLAARQLIFNTFNTSINSWLFNISTAIVDLQIFDDQQLRGPISDSFGDMASLVRLTLLSNKIQGGIPASFGNLCNLRTLWVFGVSGLLSDLLQNLTGCAKKSLQILGLSENQLEGSIPDINEFPSLRELYLDHNHLDESFPKTFMHFSQLRILNVGNNRLVGSLPDLSKMSSLTELVVGNNELTGSLTDSIDKLRKLQILDVSSNRLNGVVIEAHLSNLSQLQKLDLSHNSLSLNVNFVWVPTFKLDVIKLSSYLSSNLFHGPIPPFFYNTTVLNLSKNTFTGTVSVLCTITDSALSYLDLSENLLSGGLPNCWGQFRLLVILNLENNSLSGIIPSSIGSLHQIESMRLRNNNFTGNCLHP
ncbi:serine-threonine protein kinase, plant-type, putative [Ricinus communis]|uniref:Serine-threonine protein kinase, plant-type, putative n=1 Tax=Ricinus communis TaxID=3988 RepID=B9S524_RICCO|nr:serine-threonine protein kinase, plant-type, putative [Ricinus communis]